MTLAERLRERLAFEVLYDSKTVERSLLIKLIAVAEAAERVKELASTPSYPSLMKHQQDISAAREFLFEALAALSEELEGM